MKRGWLLGLAAIVALAAPLTAAVRWQRLISQHDKNRLREWRTTWQAALAQARAAGFSTQVAAEGVLLQPDAALDRPTPPDGRYRCRLFKIGRSLLQPSPGFLALPPAACEVAEGRLDVLEGVQRPGGQLFPYDGTRLLLLGGLAVGDEQGTVRYGRDGQRDLLGLVDRIGPERWRVAFPEPAWQSKLDVVELTPVSR
jgi:hypothetical protein